MQKVFLNIILTKHYGNQSEKHMYLTTLKKSVYKTQHKENKRQNINMRTIHDKRVVFLTYAILQINFKNS